MSYFTAHKDGVIIYYNDIKSQDDLNESNKPLTYMTESFWPKMMLKNDSLKNMIGFNPASLTDDAT